MKLPFHSGAPVKDLRRPLPFEVPELPTAEMASKYRAARVGGDFFDVLRVGDSKLVFILLDIAGKRETALHVAAAAQDFFRSYTMELYSNAHVEDGDAVTRLLLGVNRTIMTAAEGVRCAPAFLGCYDQQVSTLSYINAGHIPAILKDEDGTLLLQANGLPLGLFSHSTHDSQYCALSDGACVVLTSKGLVESKRGGEEFGIERVQKVLSNGTFSSALDVCDKILEAVEQHQSQPTRFGPSIRIPGFGAEEANDITTVVLMRRAIAKVAAAS